MEDLIAHVKCATIIFRKEKDKKDKYLFYLLFFSQLSPVTITSLSSPFSLSKAERGGEVQIKKKNKGEAIPNENVE